MQVQDLAGWVVELSDDLTPTAVESGEGLGALVANAEPIVDDEKLLRMMAAGFRLTTIGNYLMAAAAVRAHANGLAARKKLKTGRDLLRQLPLSPTAVGKLGRLGDSLAALPHLAREVRDGDLSLDHADAVVRGIAHVASRLDVEGFEQVKDEVATRLLAHGRVDDPGRISEAARELAHELAPAHPPAVPAAENPMLNEATIVQTDEGRVRIEADLDQLSGEKVMVALDGLSKPIPAPDGGRDPRTRSQRLADALVDMVDAYLDRPDRPTSGGVVPHVMLTVPLAALVPEPVRGGDLAAGPGVTPANPTAPDGGGSARTPRVGFTGPISVATASELCCGNPEVTSIITADSVPLDMTRTSRLATGEVRKALIARDLGCQFPGCGKPASWTDAHHIRPWSEGGETVLDNLVLLCRFHHHTGIHAQGWQVRIGHDRHPWFKAPGGGDWMRCHRRRTLTMHATAAD